MTKNLPFKKVELFQILRFVQDDTSVDRRREIRIAAALSGLAMTLPDILQQTISILHFYEEL